MSSKTRDIPRVKYPPDAGKRRQKTVAGTRVKYKLSQNIVLKISSFSLELGKKKH